MSSEEPPKTEEESTTVTESVAASTAEGGEEKAPEEESTATFEPVVKLEEVDVETGEEQEEVLHTQRAKLFIFGETMLDKGTGNKTWRERGVGDIRFLKHKEHQRTRLLMRQEKIMKIIANHVVDPRIKLEPNAGSDRSWVWSCFDFADGELTETVFAARFADSDIANNFKTKFEEVQKEMEKVLAGEDSASGAAEAEEAAAALEGLKTKDDEDKQ